MDIHHHSNFILRYYPMIKYIIDCITGPNSSHFSGSTLGPGNFVAPAKGRLYPLAFLSQSCELLWTLNVYRYKQRLKIHVHVYLCLSCTSFQKKKIACLCSRAIARRMRHTSRLTSQRKSPQLT